MPVPQARIPVLLPLVAKAYGATEKDLVRAGRRRKWVTARSIFVYLGRTAYAAARDKKREAALLQQLRKTLRPLIAGCWRYSMTTVFVVRIS